VAEGLETDLFRITQEALNNIARHSGATAATVNLELSKNRLRLTVADNGHGLPDGYRQKNPSLGMVGMRARARQLNGELIVENGPEGGLRIHVDAPLQKAGLHLEQEDPTFVG